MRIGLSSFYSAGTNLCSSLKEAEKEKKPIADSVATVEYRKRESGDDQKRKHKGGDPVDVSELDTAWRGKDNIDKQYDENHQNILHALVKPQHMSDGWLRRIYMGKQRIKLTSQDVHPGTSTAYHPEPKASELEKTQLYKILLMNVVELAPSEWPSLVTFNRRARVHYVF